MQMVGASTGQPPQHALANVYDMFQAERKLLYRIFTYYGSLDGTINKMTTRGFFAFASDCKIMEGPITSAALMEVSLHAVFSRSRLAVGSMLRRCAAPPSPPTPPHCDYQPAIA
jgi:hypothetical protein